MIPEEIQFLLEIFEGISATNIRRKLMTSCIVSLAINKAEYIEEFWKEILEDWKLLGGETKNEWWKKLLQESLDISNILLDSLQKVIFLMPGEIRKLFLEEMLVDPILGTSWRNYVDFFLSRSIHWLKWIVIKRNVINRVFNLASKWNFPRR